MTVDEILDALRGVDPHREIRFAHLPRNKVQVLSIYAGRPRGTVWLDIEYPSGQGNRATPMTVEELQFELAEFDPLAEVRFADSELSSIRVLGVYGSKEQGGFHWFDVMEVGTRRPVRETA